MPDSQPTSTGAAKLSASNFNTILVSAALAGLTGIGGMVIEMRSTIARIEERSVHNEMWNQKIEQVMGNFRDRLGIVELEQVRQRVEFESQRNKSNQ